MAAEPEPVLLAAGRERVPEAEWVEASASALPFEDASFDRVLSVFAAIFDPDHERVAAELGRVVRPGGTAGLTTWVAEGPMAEVAGVLSRGAPPPAPGAGSLLSWGEEDYVRSRLETAGFAVSISREKLPFTAASLEARVAHEERTSASWAAARARVGEDAWPALRDEVTAVLAAGDEGGADGFRVTSTYLAVVARR